MVELCDYISNQTHIHVSFFSATLAHIPFRCMSLEFQLALSSESAIRRFFFLLSSWERTYLLLLLFSNDSTVEYIHSDKEAHKYNVSKSSKTLPSFHQTDAF